jgi:hypothetical protein
VAGEPLKLAGPGLDRDVRQGCRVCGGQSSGNFNQPLVQTFNERFI